MIALRIKAPHSNFEYVDRYLFSKGVRFDCASLRRLFSLARALSADYLVVEAVEPCGSVADEVEALNWLLSDYTLVDLTRLSFWSFDNGTPVAEVADILGRGHLLGYALVKVDGWRERANEGDLIVRCHIFEGVFEKYPDDHNCVAFPRSFDLTIEDREFAVTGVLYCQQGPAVKSCAHVAIRSLVMTLGMETDLLYSEINRIAGVTLQPGASSPGLSGQQIVRVLRHYGLGCSPTEYPKEWEHTQKRAFNRVKSQMERCGSEVDPGVAENRLRIALEEELTSVSCKVVGGEFCLSADRIQRFLDSLGLDAKAKKTLADDLAKDAFSLSDLDRPHWTRRVQNEHPYAKFLYAGIESGGGALLGFELNSPEDEALDFHIVPFYGHTFNQDTWVPRAESSYFRMGAETRFISSHSWLSSFLMHDDNFGPNFCVPKSYLDENQVRFLVAIQRPGVRYDGVFAEGMAIDTLHSIHGDGLLATPSLSWMVRLVSGIESGQIVLRSLSLTREEYAHHLESIRDWNGNREDTVYLETARSYLPQMVWVVEFSIPELFPANLRKLGEVVLDAGVEKEKLNLKDFLRDGVCRLVRFPSRYLMFSDDSPIESFVESPSTIQSHVPLYRHNCDQTV